MRAHVNRIGTAVPPHEVHAAFAHFVRHALAADPKALRLFDRMADRAGIARRFSFLEPVALPGGGIGDTTGFYGAGAWPGTAERMARYEAWAPDLALRAVAALDLGAEAGAITHLVVASCTGFVAPGIDQILAARAGLHPNVERTVVGFMGCYAAVNALRLAHHIVRSEPAARVLTVNLELCTLHFQRTADLARLLAMLLFGDGCAAALVTAEPHGIALSDFRAATIGGSAEAITWRIGEQGFDMHLGGEVPFRIAQALAGERGDPAGLLRGTDPGDYAHWAVHAGGRTILDAVEGALALAPDALDGSRGVLRDYGNMSSATLMFVLDRLIRGGAPDGPGFGIAFGPGLAAESFRFELVR